MYFKNTVMQQLIINITNESKASSFIAFLKQLDFIKIEKENNDSILEFQQEINESIQDLKSAKTSSWKNKKVAIKNA